MTSLGLGSPSSFEGLLRSFEYNLDRGNRVAEHQRELDELRRKHAHLRRAADMALAQSMDAAARVEAARLELAQQTADIEALGGRRALHDASCRAPEAAAAAAVAAAARASP